MRHFRDIDDAEFGRLLQEAGEALALVAASISTRNDLCPSCTVHLIAEVAKLASDSIAADDAGDARPSTATVQ